MQPDFNSLNVMIPLLSPDNYHFPHPQYALNHHDGLVAVSNDLHPQRLLAAYPQGIFPWIEEDNYFYWFSTAPRAVIYPQQLHLSRSLKKTLRQQSYSISINRCFSTIINQCALTVRSHQNGTWITPAFQHAYTHLHTLGYAHSFECWYPTDNPQQLILAGGFYGVQIGQVFFGESMFTHYSNASKIAFACAIPYLAELGIAIIDCQQNSAHIAKFGANLIEFQEFYEKIQFHTKQNLIHPIPRNFLLINHKL